MDLQVLTIIWAGACFRRNSSDVGVDPLKAVESLYIFVQREHTAGNLTSIVQVDKITVSPVTSLLAGGTLEANTTSWSTFIAYFWWVLRTRGVEFAL